MAACKLPRTQAELDAIVQEIQSMPGWMLAEASRQWEEYLTEHPYTPSQGTTQSNMADQEHVLINGSVNGYPIGVTVFVGAEDWADPDFFMRTISALESMGFSKPVSAPAPARSSGGGGGNSGGNGSGGCPVHGTESVKRGYRDKGWECSVRSDSQQDWTKDKPFTPAGGNAVWYCKHRWD